MTRFMFSPGLILAAVFCLVISRPLASPVASAQDKADKVAAVKNTLAGEWLMEGREDEPCAIFQHGRVLLLVNEHGDFATARMTEGKKLTVKGWEEGLTGELVEGGKKITRSNGTTWTRAQT